jgi:hypothetical protein
MSTIFGLLLLCWLIGVAMSTVSCKCSCNPSCISLNGSPCPTPFTYSVSVGTCDNCQATCNTAASANGCTGYTQGSISVQPGIDISCSSYSGSVVISHYSMATLALTLLFLIVSSKQ